MARLARRRARLPVILALSATAVTVVLAGCATAPSGGPPQSAPGAGNQVQAYVQQLPFPGPTSKWSAKDVVFGFLHASASYAFDRAAAQQYLAPGLRKQWHPGRGPVAVLSGPTGFTERPYLQYLGQHATAEETVDFTGQQLATLSQTGQYQYGPGQKVFYSFTLDKINDVWLIESWSPDQQSLLLTESDFDTVYQPRNLFFYAPPAAGRPPTVLVPDPVYAPEQSSDSALNTDLATGLVNGLIKGQGGWLSGATVSTFPRGTRLLQKVTITGKTAKVDLGGAAARAQGVTRQQMETQLLATLGDGEYSPPLATQLALYINNKLQDTPRYTPSLVLDVAAGPVLLVSGTGSVDQLPAVPRPGIKPQPRLGPTQLGQADVTAVAASPDSDRPAIAAAVPDGNGCAVDVHSISQGNYQSYPLTGSTSPCSSLSFDANGNLWAAAGGGVWFMQPNRAPVTVDLYAMAGSLKPGDQILALRMAPDTVRAALLVQTATGNKLLLAVVRLRAGTAALGQPVSIGVGLADPLAISWYDEFHLAVLAPDSIYDVPLTGGAAQQPGAAPSLLSTAPAGADSLTTDGSELVVGTGGQAGQVWAASVSAPSFYQVADGTDPIYPG